MKELRVGALLASSGRLFHNFTPWHEKYLSLFTEDVFGILRSVKRITHATSFTSRISSKKVAMVLRSQPLKRLVDTCLWWLFGNRFFDGFPFRSFYKWSAQSIKFAVGENSSRSVLKYLEVVFSVAPQFPQSEQ